MRIAIVSDIHANLTLDAVIPDLRRTGVDLVVHGGDLDLLVGDDLSFDMLPDDPNPDFAVFAQPVERNHSRSGQSFRVASIV